LCCAANRRSADRPGPPRRSVTGGFRQCLDLHVSSIAWFVDSCQAAAVRYNAVLDACELIFRLPDQAQALSSAITTPYGIRFRLPVAGHPPFKVFWSSEGPRIEAVFPHP
jgi:hypothetical protein